MGGQKLVQTSRIFLEGSNPLKVPTKKSESQFLFKSLARKMGSCFGSMDLKWVGVARIGLKLGGNEATRFRIIFKPYFYIKKCLVGVSLG